MSGVDTTHPDYDDDAEVWGLIRDGIAGSVAVKKRGTTHLPMPSGFTAQSDKGAAMYFAYQLRAKFPEILGPTVRGMVGIVHRMPAEIQLPKKLEPLRERATLDGLSLVDLHERITYEVLATGRYGLLVDIDPEGNDGLPYVATYRAEAILNWSNAGDFFVLDETRLDRVGFEWEAVPQFRVLELNDDRYEVALWDESSKGETIIPQARFGSKFTEIPFTVVGSTDISPDIDEIPLAGVAEAAFAMYRLDADYRHQLFMSGQETLFVLSDTDTTVDLIGASVVVQLPAGSDARYVGPSCRTIATHKEAIVDERQQAVIAGARMFDTERKSTESGEALKVRWAAQTASLVTVAINSAKGLERALKHCALFVGADPKEVVVKPNLRFVDSTLDPKDAKALMELWMGGAISKQTLYEQLQRGEIASHERTFEDEQELIAQEVPDIED